MVTYSSSCTAHVGTGDGQCPPVYFLINDSYEAAAALKELLAGKPFKTDDYIRLSPLEGSKTLADSSSQIMLYSRMFQKGF